MKKPYEYLRNYPQLVKMLDKNGFELKEMMWKAMEEYANQFKSGGKGLPTNDSSVYPMLPAVCEAAGNEGER